MSRLTELALKAYEDHPEDSDAAVRDILAALHADRSLRNEALEKVAGDLLRGARQAVRTATFEAKRGYSGHVRTYSEEEVAAASVVLRLWMDLPLPVGGKKLGSACRDDLAVNIHHYNRQGKEMLVRGRMLELIGDRLSEDEEVSDVLDEDEISALEEQARREINRNTH